MKKIKFLLFILIALFAFVLVGCGDEPEDPGTDPTDNPGETTLQRDVAVADANLECLLQEGKKLYVTSFGQASFSYMKTIVDDAIEGSEVDYSEDKALKASDVEAGDVVIAVVGFTSKGLEQGVTQTTERERAAAFGNRSDIILIICQLDGKERRGDSSDPIIEAAIKGADLVLIYDSNNGSGADYDGKYSEVWVKDLSKLYLFSDEYDITDYISVLAGAK